MVESIEVALKLQEKGLLVDCLDATNTTYTTLPKDIKKLTDLTALRLSVDCLDGFINDSLLYLDKLKVLEIRGSIGIMDSRIFELSSLDSLRINGGKIRKIPKEIAKLTNLIALDLMNNYIQTIPKEIGDLSSIEKLDLSCNYITKFPKELGNLSNLTTLYAYSNKIQTLPKELGNMGKLAALEISNNNLNIPIHDLIQMFSTKIIKLYSYKRDSVRIIHVPHNNINDTLLIFNRK